MNKTALPKVIFGSILILLGTGFFAEQIIPGFDIGFIFSYFWPIIFILIGINIVIKSPRSPLFGIFFIGLGLALILDNFMPFNIWSLWPLILVFTGISIILGKSDFNSNTTKSTLDKDSINLNTFFWATDTQVVSKNFKGGSVNVVFGGAKLDLRNIQVTEDAVLELNAIFGGIEVILPTDISVNVDGSGIFGGFENKAKISENSKVLKITGSAVFGGVEIK